MKIFAFLISVCFCSVFAQTMTYSTVTEKTCNVYSTAYEIDENFLTIHSKYKGVANGCNAFVVDLVSSEAVASFDILKNGIDSTARNLVYVYFYKNFFTDDGSWTTVVNIYGISTTIYHDGKKITFPIKGSAPDIRIYDGKLFMIFEGKDEKEQNVMQVYMIRNDVKMTSSPQSRKIPVNYKSASDLLWEEYDPAGRSLNDGNTPRNVKLLRR